MEAIDVALISIYGRGHWLASELSRQGLKVALIDISREMGRWTPEDWEGPFGFFRSEALSPSQLARLVEDCDPIEVDQGFTVWPPQGPIEFKSSMTPFLLDIKGLSSEHRQILNSSDTLNSHEVTQLKTKILEEDFDKNWIGHLAHQLASHIFVLNANGMKQGKPLPLFSPYFIRRTSRKGFDDSLKWCSNQGIVVYSDSTILDIDIQGKNIFGMEIKGQFSGLLKSNYWIWMLSSQESQRLPDSGYKKLFPEGFIEPSWSWIRYRIHLSTNEVTDSLPIKFVLISDIYLPWSHSNLAIAQKASANDNYDFWVRIPTFQRFQKKYVGEIGSELMNILRKRLPGTEITEAEMPQDYLYNYQEIGPARFPVFEKNELNKLITIKLDNLYFDGPEYWESLDWGGQFYHQNKILSEILDLRLKTLDENSEDMND